ncbi:MAG: hypothetical protein AAF995_04495 [Planctomycetota bacterium]
MLEQMTSLMARMGQNGAFDNVDWDGLTGVLIVGMGCMVGMTAIVFGIMAGISERKQLEESRRELAAYVAEGSMTPDDAERLLEAGSPGARKRRKHA